MNAPHPPKESAGVSNPNHPDQLAFTIVSTSDRTPVGKRYWLDAQESLQTETAATISKGTVDLTVANSITQFGEILEALGPHQAVLFGIPRVSPASLLTRSQYESLSKEQRVGAISRTREFIEFPHAPGLLMLDFDFAGVAAAGIEAVSTPDKIRALLIRAIPELADAPMLWRCSSSSHIYHGDKEIQGLRGQRIYVALSHASEIPKLGNLLSDRLWLLGYGHYLVSKSGQLLERTLIDASVWQPERLDFAAPPVCVSPLERRAPRYHEWNSTSPYFDARRAQALSLAEQRTLKARRSSAKLLQMEAARRQRVAWAEDRGRHIAQNRGIAAQEGVRIAQDAVEHRVLRGDFELVTEDGERVTVIDVLNAPDRWHGRRFADPIEPDYRSDHRIAWVNLHPKGGKPFLYSHAHGGVRYTLSRKRETLRIREGELPRIVDDIERILVGTADIFQLKDQLVRVTDSGRLASIDPEWISDFVQRQADVVKVKRVNDELVELPADLPTKYGKTLLSKGGQLDVPELVAISNGPFLRSDGTLVDEPGYDSVTQVLYAPAASEMPPVRPRLTIPEAEDALRLVMSAFSEFPLAGDLDRSCLLALIFTAVLRPGMAIAPGGLIESHDAGSGKTLMAEAIANLTGVPAAPQALAQYEDETRKSLFAVARAGIPAILYDNVGRDRAVDSAALAMALTSGTIADRILGESTYATVPFRSLVLFTGNNTRISGDLNRRLLRVRIAPNVEDPWRRTFPFCPKARTAANWPAIRVAALELVLTAMAEPAPSMKGGTGFPDWEIVRRTVCWIGENLNVGLNFEDPARSFLAGYDEDPERDRLSRFYQAWNAAFGSKAVTVQQIARALAPIALVDGAPGRTAQEQEGLDQLSEIFRELGTRDGPQAIGIFLKQQKGRIRDGFVLVKSGTVSNVAKWTLQKAVGNFETDESSQTDALNESGLTA